MDPRSSLISISAGVTLVWNTVTMCVFRPFDHLTSLRCTFFYGITWIVFKWSYPVIENVVQPLEVLGYRRDVPDVRWSWCKFCRRLNISTDSILWHRQIRFSFDIGDTPVTTRSIPDQQQIWRHHDRHNVGSQKVCLWTAEKVSRLLREVVDCRSTCQTFRRWHYLVWEWWGFIAIKAPLWFWGRGASHQLAHTCDMSCHSDTC